MPAHAPSEVPSPPSLVTGPGNGKIHPWYFVRVCLWLGRPLHSQATCTEYLLLGRLCHWRWHRSCKLQPRRCNFCLRIRICCPATTSAYFCTYLKARRPSFSSATELQVKVNSLSRCLEASLAARREIDLHFWSRWSTPSQHLHHRTPFVKPPHVHLAPLQSTFTGPTRSDQKGIMIA